MKRLGLYTTSMVFQWTAPDSGYRPFRRDPSLNMPFDKFAKDNRLFYKFALSTMGSSYAAAHLLMHAAAFVEEFPQHLPTVVEGPNWAKWCVDVASSFQANILLPLKDSVCYSSGSVGSSVMAVRTGVIKSAEVAIQPILRTSPPSAGFFFGDPVTGFDLSQLCHDVVVDQEKVSRCKAFRQASGCCCSAGRCYIRLFSFHVYGREGKRLWSQLQRKGRRPEMTFFSSSLSSLSPSSATTLRYIENCLWPRWFILL